MTNDDKTISTHADNEILTNTQHTDRHGQRNSQHTDSELPTDNVNYKPGRLLLNNELNIFLDELNNKSIKELTKEYCYGEFNVEMIVNEVENAIKHGLVVNDQEFNGILNIDPNSGSRGYNKNGGMGRYTVHIFCLNLLIHNLFDKPYSEENIKKANLYKEFWLECNKIMLEEIIDKKINNFEGDFARSIEVEKYMNQQHNFMKRNELSGMNVCDYSILLEKEKQGATKEEIQKFNNKKSWEEIPEDQEILCNYCSLSCNLNKDENEKGTDDYIANGGLINCEVMGGYYSTPGNGNGALDDMMVYKFSICEYCLDHLFGKFKIAPRMIQWHGTKSEPWISAKERIKEREQSSFYKERSKEDWEKINKEFDEKDKLRNDARSNVQEK